MKPKQILKKQAKKPAGIEYVDPSQFTYATAKSPADLRKAMKAEQQSQDAGVKEVVDKMQSVALQELQVMAPKIVERTQVSHEAP